MEPGHESAIWFTVKLFGFLIGWNCDLIFWADVFVWLSLKAAASELFRVCFVTGSRCDVCTVLAPPNSTVRTL